MLNIRVASQIHGEKTPHPKDTSIHDAGNNQLSQMEKFQLDPY